MSAITGDNIDLFRMSILEKALKLELLGMRAVAVLPILSSSLNSV